VGQVYNTALSMGDTPGTADPGTDDPGTGPELGKMQPSYGTASSSTLAKENPYVTQPPRATDDPLTKWMKQFYGAAKGGPPPKGMPPEVTSKHLEAHGYLQADGTRLSLAELRRRYPNDRDLRDAIYASKVLEKDNLDKAFKRSQIETLAYERAMRPAKLLDMVLSNQQAFTANEISLEQARNQYERLLMAAREYNKGVPRGKGKNRTWLQPKRKIIFYGDHHFFKGLPLMKMEGAEDSPGTPPQKKTKKSSRRPKGNQPPLKEDNTDFGYVSARSNASKGGKGERLTNVRLFNMNQVRLAYNRVKYGFKDKKGHFDAIRIGPSHAKLDRSYRKLQALSGQTNSADWKKETLVFAKIINDGNDAYHVSGASKHPGKKADQHKADRQRWEAQTGTRLDKLINARKAWVEASEKITLESVMKDFSGTRLRLGNQSKNITKEDVKAYIEYEDIPRLAQGKGEDQQATIDFNKAYIEKLKSLGDRYKARLKDKKDKLLKNTKAAMRRNWSLVNGKFVADESGKYRWKANPGGLDQFLLKGVAAPSPKYWPLPSYDKGGPVTSDGFLTDEKGTPYARVHKGEHIVPGGANDMGVNPEQMLWLKWERQDLSKKQKQAGFAKDIRILRKARNRAMRA
tara:strand:- start:1684 stop:3573 length:1890 start_codon:yes stop_codon:yes gene_type:complete